MSTYVHASDAAYFARYMARRTAEIAAGIVTPDDRPVAAPVAAPVAGYITVSDDAYGYSDYRRFGEHTVASFATAVCNGEILRSPYGYIAAFVTPTGTVLPGTCHAAFDSGNRCSVYDEAFALGYVRLCVAENRNGLTVHVGDNGATLDQYVTVKEIVAAFGPTRCAISTGQRAADGYGALEPTIYDVAAPAMLAAFGRIVAATATVAAPATRRTVAATPVARRYNGYRTARPYRGRTVRHITARPNRYAAPCATCGTAVAAGAGTLTRHAGAWVIRCATCATVA